MRFRSAAKRTFRILLTIIQIHHWKGLEKCYYWWYFCRTSPRGCPEKSVFHLKKSNFQWPISPGVRLTLTRDPHQWKIWTFYLPYTHFRGVADQRMTHKLLLKWTHRYSVADMESNVPKYCSFTQNSSNNYCAKIITVAFWLVKNRFSRLWLVWLKPIRKECALSYKHGNPYEFS